MYERLIEDINLRRLSVRRPIFTTPPQMARCCLFWFSLPGPCITFCVCQRYGHNIYLYTLLHTPSIIFATHYLSLIWALEKPLIFGSILLVYFGSPSPVPAPLFVCVNDMDTIFTYTCYCTHLVLFLQHTTCHLFGPKKNR